MKLKIGNQKRKLMKPSWFFQKVNKTDKLLTKLRKKKEDTS
jgi:hypothetical protein